MAKQLEKYQEIERSIITTYRKTIWSPFVLAVKKYGPLRGSLKGAWRILRCNPFSKGGTDWP